MKTFLFTLFVCACNMLAAQETKLPLEIKNAHLYSQWKLNDTINANVFLETGFPKIVFSETFAKKHLQGVVNMTEAENTSIALWNNQRYTVTCLINDSLTVNGKKMKIDALVADIPDQSAWEGLDIVFPLQDLDGKVELNIKEKYMKILDKNQPVQTGFMAYNVYPDSVTKGLYMTTTLHAYDADGKKEVLSGNFLLDLGAGGPFFLNKNLQEVTDFVLKSDRMILKDTTQFKPNPKTELSIIMPKQIRIDNVEIEGSFIAAMKMFPMGSNKYVGMIGNPFFVNFIIIFDFDNNKFYIKPNSDKVTLIEQQNPGIEIFHENTTLY